MIRGAHRATLLCIATLVPHCLGHEQPLASHGESASSPSARTTRFTVAEMVYDDGTKNGWQISGRAPLQEAAGGPLQARFSDDAELTFSKLGLTGEYGGIAFRVRGPIGEGEFLEVRLEPRGEGTLPGVKVAPDQRLELGNGWTEVVIWMDRLNPSKTPFERIVFRAFRPFGPELVLIDKVSLTTGEGRAPSASAAAGKPARLQIACDARATKISPLIYGVGGYAASHMPSDVGSTIHRWGGNGTSRYNWESHVANAARDWFFENHPQESHELFLSDNMAQGRLSALTIPILGWVAKDATSYSFPVSVFGPQGKTDPSRPDAGDGTKPSGAPIDPGPPSRTSVAAPPDWVKRWVQSIRADDAKTGKRSASEYILDNEPMIWNATHRDVRPGPLGYDELLDRTIQYGRAIREADPGAVIAGPAEWGWPNYFFSAKDSAVGLARKPDRRAHDNVPLVEWYLRKLREYEQKSGTRILDVLDLHYYPQAKNVFSDAADPVTAALRLRATLSLWDPSYVDESWIDDSIHLLPRMKQWIDKNYPGRGISIGEWNFGGEKDVTGALATAEALGRFAQFGVTSAFYWTAPPAGSPSAQGFLAYRNFDGKGGRFLDWYLPTTTTAGVSLFASRDEHGKHLVLVAINLSPDSPLLGSVDLSSCGPVASLTSYAYARGATGFTESVRADGAERTERIEPAFAQLLAPWSITVIDVQLARPLGDNIER